MADNGRKRIALLLGQPEEYYQSCFISGFLESAFGNNLDVCVYAMYIKYQNNPAREKGESAIFSLIPYDRFDAVVVMADTIQTPGIASEIEEKIHKDYKGKVLFVDSDSPYFPSIHTDNYNPEKKIVSHLIEKHGYRDIIFLAGKSWHPHSQIRLQAYKDAMTEHGLKVDEKNIYYGDFWYTSGESLAETLLSSDRPLPDAVACANDCMAMGLANGLIRGGVRIPEDVAVVGYDSINESRHAPIPVTSVNIPSDVFGRYAADTVYDMICGGTVRPFRANPDLFIGGTCGCGCDSARPAYYRRDSWSTELSEGTVHSVLTHMDEDLMEQSTVTGLISSIFSYTYLIGSFDSFDICLNRNWENFSDNRNNRGKFEDNLVRIISCGSEDESRNKISFDQTIRSDELLPEICDQRDKPEAYFFMPMNYEDIVYGYAVISYSDPGHGITGEYRSWLKSVTRSLEYFRRTEALIRGNRILGEGSLRDNLTGLYNYHGFYKQAATLVGMTRNNGGYVSVLAVDICDLSKINNTYGRRDGDNAIIAVASILDSVFSTRNCLCFCIGNGEMVAVRITTREGESEILELKEEFMRRLHEYNEKSELDFDIALYSGIETGSPEDVTSLEALVNVAVLKKNTVKTEAHRIRLDQTLTPEEQEEANLVCRILDDNLIDYHFQPIVNAKDGSIYAYEALMRPCVTPHMMPDTVLRYATYLNRLYDVEKLTYMNVSRIIIEKDISHGGTRKVFVNSIPGQRLTDDSVKEFREELDKVCGSMVVELTEKSEISDEELRILKSEIESLGMQVAVDDYGTGYSNVSNFLRYMPDYVKIDRMLLSGIHVSPQKQHFVKDIIQFSHDNGIMALAEGVENVEEMKAVIELGIDLLQGYYVSRPSKKAVDSIPKSIIDEITTINLGSADSPQPREYYAGRESRINMASLCENKYSSIVIRGGRKTYNDFIVAGVPGIDSLITIMATEGYSGKIILDNASLGISSHSGPAIDITDGSSVTLSLRGNSYLNGGIRVSEDSTLVIDGDGLLAINVSGDEYYGVGNGIGEEHGDLIFEQNGTLSIMGSGKNGIGIGSGLGGNISIRRGKYILNIMGDEGVGIGASRGPANMEISECSIESDLSFTNSVTLGSISGAVDINMRNVGFFNKMNGRNCIAIGSVGSKDVSIKINSVGIENQIKSERACVLGTTLIDDQHCSEDRVKIYARCASVKSKITGEKSIFAGDPAERNGELDLKYVEIDSVVKNALDYDIGAHLVNDDQVSIDLKLSHNGTDRDSLDTVTEYSE